MNTDPEWHSLPFDEVLTLLAAVREGLSPHEVVQRCARYGANRLSPSVRCTVLRRFLLRMFGLVAIDTAARIRIFGIGVSLFVAVELEKS